MLSTYTDDVVVTWEVLMGSHKNCIAQQAYFDVRPRDIPREKAQILVEPGSVIVAVHVSSSTLCPKQENRSTRRSSFQLKYNCQCMLFMTNIAHAGYGLWDLGEAFFAWMPIAR